MSYFIKNSAVVTARINDDAVTKEKIDSSLAGLGIVQNEDGSLEINPDNSTLELSSDILQIKDLGVDTAQLAADAVTTLKILNANVTDAKLASTPTVTGGAAGDSGKLVKLDAEGHIDASLINDADIDLDNITEGSTNLFFTSDDNDKLDGIEASADVTDAENVALAGAVMESDTTTADMDFVVDEDDMASDSATKIPTQQSVKAYVDAEVSAAIASEMSYKGSYDASGDPSATASVGDVYTVTVAGTGAADYWTDALEVGDVIIAEITDPASEADWTVVNKNLDAASIKTLYESNSNTNAFTDADESKLDGIEAEADVTDADNVALAGAVMESDTTTADMDFVVDEDDMSSDSDTKIPTQQSVKAYVDAENTKAIVSKTAAYTVTDADDFIAVDTTAGDVTITLLALASRTKNRPVYIKKVAGANNVIIDGDGAETIDGAATQTIAILYESLSLIPGASEWYIF